MRGALDRRMLQPIEPHLLRHATGGTARVAANARSSGNTAMRIASLQSAIQAVANKPSRMQQILPAMIAMAKGDKKGAIAALMDGSTPSGGDHKPG